MIGVWVITFSTAVYSVFPPIGFTHVVSWDHVDGPGWGGNQSAKLFTRSRVTKSVAAETRGGVYKLHYTSSISSHIMPHVFTHHFHGQYKGKSHFSTGLFINGQFVDGSDNTYIEYVRVFGIM